VAQQVINFYMCLLQEHCNSLCSSGDKPTVQQQKTTETKDAGGGNEEKEEKEEKSEESAHAGTPPRCYFFNTFFYPLLKAGGHARVARWTRRVDLLSMDLIVIPIHSYIHWTLATVSPTDRTIAYYDSMRQPNPECLELLRSYLKQEESSKSGPLKDKARNEAEERKGWRIANRVKDCPRQANGSDCGVFTCMFARFCALSLPLARLHQRDMPYYRKLMALEILSASIMDRRQ